MLKRVFWKHHHGEDGGESSDSDSDSGSDPGSTLSDNEIQEQQGIRQNLDDSEGGTDSDGSRDNSEESEGGGDNGGSEDESEDDMEDDEDDSGTSDAPNLTDEAAEHSDRVGHAGSDSDEEPAAQTWQQFLESRDAEEEEEEEDDSEDEDGLECFRSTAEPLELLAQGDILRCFACGVLVLNAAAYTSHVASKKHARKVAKWPGSLHGLQPVVKASAVEGKYEAQETHAERLERMRIEAEEAAQKSAGKIAGKKRQRSKVQAERKRPGKRQRAELRAAGLALPPKKHKPKTPGDGAKKQGPSVQQGGPSLKDVPSKENSRKVSASTNGQHSGGKRNADASGKDSSKRAFTPAVGQHSSKHNSKPPRKKAAATPWSAVTNKNGGLGQPEAAKQQPAAVLKSAKQPQSVPAVLSAKQNVHMQKQKSKKKLNE